MDKMTPQQRSYCMSRIRAVDTKPEMLVRRFLWRHGYRYRLYGKKLPGRPDIVLARLKTVIFINGCFWHGHACKSSKPTTNAAYWAEKIERNRQRDQQNGIALRALGWNVITIWECELKKSIREKTLEKLLDTLRSFETSPEAPSPNAYTYPEPEYSIAAEDEATYQ